MRRGPGFLCFVGKLVLKLKRQKFVQIQLGGTCNKNKTDFPEAPIELIFKEKILASQGLDINFQLIQKSDLDSLFRIQLGADSVYDEIDKRVCRWNGQALSL